MQRLRESGLFSVMSVSVDEDEHSIEMHLPYLRKVLADRYFLPSCIYLVVATDILALNPVQFTIRRQIPIVPVLVGALNVAAEKMYGKFFADILIDPSNLFIVSSDFCHWGSRFQYTFLPSAPPRHKIHERIEALDREAMDIIAKCDADGFKEYLKRTENTICGRHPISVLLFAVKSLKDSCRVNDASFTFTHYEQSNPAKSKSDSSVSYASAHLTFSA